jgi:quinol monooxygenase YgiN
VSEPDSAPTPSGPVVVTAVFVPRAGSFAAVTDVLSRAIARVHDEPGCLLYAIHRDPEDRIIMIEKWESSQLLDDHGAGEAVAELNRDIDGLLAEPVLVTRLVPIPAGTADQGQL